jgi:hypothetical protein
MSPYWLMEDVSADGLGMYPWYVLHVTALARTVPVHQEQKRTRAVSGPSLLAGSGWILDPVATRGWAQGQTVRGFVRQGQNEHRTPKKHTHT